MNLQAFLAGLKLDVFMAVLPVIGKAATSLAANPSGLNRVAVLSQLLVDVPAALTAVEPVVLGQLATAINTEIQAEIAKAAQAAGSATSSTVSSLPVK